jgi:DNA-binding IclR family transcriptional regulator
MTSEHSGVAAVDRALLILSVFQEGDAPLTLAVLARRTGLYKSTILRLLQSLIRAGFVLRLSDGCYVIGPAAARLAKLQHAAP